MSWHSGVCNKKQTVLYICCSFNNIAPFNKMSLCTRSTWRSGVRSAMRAASQLPGRGPTDVDDAPAPAH